MGRNIYIPDRMNWHPSVWWSRLKMSWPFFIWLLAVVGAAYLFMHGGRFSGMSGVVDTVRERVAPLETARLNELNVVVGEPVEAGQVVARMDTSILDSELALQKLQTDRQFAATVNDLRADLRDLRRRQAEDQAELSVLREEIERMEPLVEQRLMPARDLVELRARAHALAEAVKLYPEMLEELRAELDQARERTEYMERWLAAVPGTGSLTNRSAVRTWSITETEGRTGLLQLRRDAYVLRADAAGTVAAINYDPGEIVPAGDSVVVVLVEQTSRVLGYLPEVNAGDVTAGMTVYLSSATRAGEIVPGEVVAMVPEIMAMPSQGSPFLNRSVRGRTVIIEPEEPGAFVPGESVKIQLTRPILSVMKDWILGRSKRDGST